MSKKTKTIVVERYKGNRRLRRGIQRMADAGYEVQSHTTTRAGFWYREHNVVFKQIKP
jgi:hypothetical protein